MRTLLALMMLTWACAVQAQTTVIRNGKLTSTLDGNGQDITLLDQMWFGASSGGSGRIVLLPSGSPTTAADGLQLGSDVNIYRSASDTLTIASSLVVTGSITGSGGIPTLNGTQTWTNPNTFSAVTTFALSPVLQQGISVGGSGTVRSQIQTELLLRPGTDVQAYSARLQSIAEATPGSNYFLTGTGSGWVSIPSSSLLNTLGLGAASNASFNSLTLATPLSVVSGGSGLSTYGAANRVLYSTGATTLAATELDSWARTNLLTAGSASVLRETLGLATTDTVVFGTLQPANPLAVAYGGSGMSTYGAADRLLYSTGATTLATTPITAAARALLDDSTADAMLATLGLGPPVPVVKGGTGLSTVAANKLIYTTALDTFGSTDISAFGRTLVATADADAARLTLQLASTSAVTFDSLTLTTPLSGSVGGVGLDVSALPAGHMLYADGDGVMSSVATSAFMRSLLDSADLAAFQAATGLGVPMAVTSGGTGITTVPSLNQMLVGNGTGYTLTSMQAFGVAMLQQADAAAVRNYVDLGSADDVTFNSVDLATVLAPADGGVTPPTAAERTVFSQDLDPGAGTNWAWSATALTEYARLNLFTAADAAGLRTGIGLGSASDVEFGSLSLNTLPLDVLSGGTGRDLSDNAAYEFNVARSSSGAVVLRQPLRSALSLTGSGGTVTLNDVNANDWRDASSIVQASSASGAYTITLPGSTYTLYDDSGDTGAANVVPYLWDGRELTVINRSSTYNFTVDFNTPALVRTSRGAFATDIVIPPNCELKFVWRTSTTAAWYIVSDEQLRLCPHVVATPGSGVQEDVSSFAIAHPTIRFTDNSGTAPVNYGILLPAPTSFPLGHEITCMLEDVSWSGTLTVTVGGSVAFAPGAWGWTGSGPYYQTTSARAAATTFTFASTSGPHILRFRVVWSASAGAKIYRVIWEPAGV